RQEAVQRAAVERRRDRLVLQGEVVVEQVVQVLRVEPFHREHVALPDRAVEREVPLERLRELQVLVEQVHLRARRRGGAVRARLGRTAHVVRREANGTTATAGSE